MNGLLAALGVETAVLSRRVRLFALGALIGAVLIVLATAFLAFAGYLALAEFMKPWQAALTTGALALFLGAILVAGGFEALSRASDQVQVAVRNNTLAKAAPFAARLAVRNPRLVAGAAAAVAALFTLLRALGSKTETKS